MGGEPGKMRAMRFAAFALLALSSLALHAQLYRWTDSTGRTHVTDTPPPSDAKGVQKRAASAPAAESSSEPYALRQAMKDFPVTLYTLPKCEGCTQARKLLNARGVPFKEFSVNNESELAQLQSAVGSNSVPSLLVGATVLKGFEEGAYQRALDTAGYPKTGIAPPRAQAEPKPQQENAQAPTAKPAAPPTKKSRYYSGE